jgi:HD superfamily phosphohydrolase YqeK
MKIPTLSEAEKLLEEAEQRNPGPWVAHSRNVALAAKSIAEHHPDLAAETAFIFGLLHDIGWQEGVTKMRHTAYPKLWDNSLPHPGLGVIKCKNYDDFS